MLRSFASDSVFDWSDFFTIHLDFGFNIRSPLSFLIIQKQRHGFNDNEC
jgi:hypothetical protein